MRIVFFGSSEFAIPTFDSIRGDGHDIPLVVSQPDKPQGRGKKLTPTPLKAAALEECIPVITPENVNAPEVVAQIRECRADLGYVVAFGQFLARELRESVFPAGMVNLHGSVLPALRGAAPIQWSVINGSGEAGVTTFRIVKEMDAGPILITRRTAINEDETSSDLHDRLARIGCDAVRETIKLLETDPKTPGEPQDHSLATIAPKLQKSDGFIRFDFSARALCSRINGLWDWPGAVCRFVSADGKRDERVTIARVRPYEGRTQAAANDDELGRISETMAVQARDGAIEILEIKPAGKNLMPWPDFVNGRRVRPGDRFLPVEPQA
ncbi:MAG: methionyl-tRNA formyltransferase [Phycisphaerales bacterium]|nr:methionyl-tRNA formyltransferase [Phycisphaerales bacterium]MCB9857250.1 methionyl-tRNA formyltransferase [Phycisphaerales bacterium]MCB9863036.1 methionyl-tRNA formyltransferase [Phycisphaerales bacterium]